MTATRVEHDSLGPVNVPADRLWGAQTQRSLEHFSIGDDLMPREMIPAYALVKKAAALVNHDAGRPLTIEEVPIPQPGTGQVLVKVHACGVCGTDLHAASGDWPVKPKPPFIPGHEGVGHVAAVGPSVTHLREGDRVGVPWLHTACGHCSY